MTLAGRPDLDRRAATGRDQDQGLLLVLGALDIAAALPSIDVLQRRCSAVSMLDYTPAGAFIKGFDHESEMADPQQLWPGLVDGLPALAGYPTR